MQINRFYVWKKFWFDKIKIYYDIFRPLCCDDQHFLSFIGISIMRVLGQKHSDKTSILTFFKVYSPYIKSGRRREQDGQALNGPHNKSNIKTGGASSTISTNSGTIIILPMKGCVRVFRTFSVYEINEVCSTYFEVLDVFFEVFLTMEQLLRLVEVRGHSVKIDFKSIYFFHDFVMEFW